MWYVRQLYKVAFDGLNIETKLWILTQVADSEHGTGKSEPASKIIAERQEEEFGPVKEMESVDAMGQLRVLCQMMDTFLQPQILLHGCLNADTPKVGFHELWYIFRPGCEVRTRDAHQIQA